MSKPYIDYVKCAVMVNNKNELFDFMMIARKCSKDILKLKKNCIFIAMGEIGGISRVWPEFTNTKIVFLTAYSDKSSKIGQFTYENFVKYRNMLEKNVKN
jgi:3-dehydroquinate dehydratase